MTDKFTMTDDEKRAVVAEARAEYAAALAAWKEADTVGTKFDELLASPIGQRLQAAGERVQAAYGLFHLIPEDWV